MPREITSLCNCPCHIGIYDPTTHKSQWIGMKKRHYFTHCPLVHSYCWNEGWAIINSGFLKKKIPLSSQVYKLSTCLFFTERPSNGTAQRWYHSIVFRINVAWKHCLTEKTAWNWTEGLLHVLSSYTACYALCFLPYSSLCGARRKKGFYKNGFLVHAFQIGNCSHVVLKEMWLKNKVLTGVIQCLRVWGISRNSQVPILLQPWAS